MGVLSRLLCLPVWSHLVASIVINLNAALSAILQSVSQVLGSVLGSIGSGSVLGGVGSVVGGLLGGNSGIGGILGVATTPSSMSMNHSNCTTESSAAAMMFPALITALLEVRADLLGMQLPANISALVNAQIGSALSANVAIDLNALLGLVQPGGTNPISCLVSSMSNPSFQYFNMR